MENKHCQAELEGMVRDCGANLLKWDCKDLSMKTDEELELINVIYTDMSDTIMYDLDFLRFMNRNRVSFHLFFFGINIISWHFQILATNVFNTDGTKLTTPRQSPNLLLTVGTYLKFWRR